MINSKIKMHCHRQLQVCNQQYIKFSSKLLESKATNGQSLYVVCGIFNNGNFNLGLQLNDYLNQAVQQMKFTFQVKDRELPECSLGLLEAKSFLSIDLALKYADRSQHIFCIAYDGENQFCSDNIAWFYHPEPHKKLGIIVINKSYKPYKSNKTH